MTSRIVTIVLVIAIVFTAIAMAPRIVAMRLPGNHAGFEPVQPIAFSHRLHAGELNIACLYCHSGAEVSRHAGTPAASTCMNCHRFITAPRSMVRAEEELAKKQHRKPRPVTSPELRKIYRALNTNQPIAWTRIDQTPAFVYFNHSAHVNAGVQCQTCHGPVETMERVRQIESLNMGWCLNCHRTNARHPSTDCSTCHH